MSSSRRGAKAQLWIVAIDGFVGRDTAITIEGAWEKERLYAIVQTTSKGAFILDSAYRTRAEAKAAWPEAK